MYKVPPTYGGFSEAYPGKVEGSQIGLPVNLSEAQAVADGDPERLKVYPASMEVRDGRVYALKSRAVCTVGIGDSIQDAREAALDALERIRGGALWYRGDIASRDHIEASIRRMRRLRGS